MSYDCEQCGGDLTGCGGHPCICEPGAERRDPMTTKEAWEKHACTVCHASDSKWCGKDCVESQTCSNRCKNCNGRVWFSGDYKTGLAYICPYCKSQEKLK